MALIPVILRISILKSDSGGSGIGERRRLSFSAVPVIVIGDNGRMFSGLMIGREHLPAPETNSLNGGKLILTSSESAEDGVETETDEAVELSEGTLNRSGEGC